MYIRACISYLVRQASRIILLVRPVNGMLNRGCRGSRVEGDEEQKEEDWRLVEIMVHSQTC